MEGTQTSTFADQIRTVKQQFIECKQLANEAATLIEPIDAQMDAEIEAVKVRYWTENAEAYELFQTATQTLADTGASLREMIVDAYMQTGTKSFDENLGVQVRTKINYEIADAVEWAEINAPVMIQKSIDKKAFEALPSTKDLEFVTVEETVSAVIKGL